MKLKKFAAIMIGTAIMAGSLCGCGKTENKTGESTEKASDGYGFKIGTANGSLCLAPLHIAADNGYFDEEFEAAGIKYELVEIDLSNAADLTATGQIDASLGLAGSLLPQIDNGLEIAFTGGLHTGCTKYYVQKNSEIESVADLKGKKIGVPSLGDSSVIALKRKLFDVGIGTGTTNMEVELIPYAMTDLPLALDNGAVDAIALHDPVAYSAEQEYGFKKILDLTEDEKFKNEYCCQIYVSIDSAKKHPEAAAAYTRALLKASAFVQAKPEEAAKLQIDNKQCSGELEVNSLLLSSYNYSPSVSGARKTFKDAYSELVRIGDFNDDKDIEAFTEEHFRIFDNVPDSFVFENGNFKEV